VAVVRRVPPHFSMAPDSVEVLPGGSVNLTGLYVHSEDYYYSMYMNELISVL